MNVSTIDESQRKAARVAGNAVATAQKILAHERLFRIGIACDLIDAGPGSTTHSALRDSRACKPDRDGRCMNTQANAVNEPPLSETRPMYWSVCRELWENRSIDIAPVSVAAVFLFGFLISAITLPHRMRAVSALDPARQRAAVAMPYSVAAFRIIVTAGMVGVFYCLDALHGERRDRSILFWKSLPVSDRTTLLSKASIPLVVLPLFSFGTMQSIILLLSTAVLLGNLPSLAALWTNVKFFQSSLALFYALTAIALWHAPIYGWLLLVSSWARRATFLWAVLPFFAISAFEWIAFRTSHFASLLRYRLIGWFMQVRLWRNREPI